MKRNAWQTEGESMSEKIIVNHLATVESGDHLSPYAIPTVKLLQDNFNQLSKHYFIHDISDLYERLPPHEDVYVLSHIVTEDFPKHNHDYFELTYVIEGNVLNIIDGNELYMRMGDICLVNPQAVHELRCINPDTTLVNICIKPSLMDGTLQRFARSDSPVSTFLSGPSEKVPFKNAASSPDFARTNESIPANYTQGHPLTHAPEGRADSASPSRYTHPGIPYQMRFAPADSASPSRYRKEW